MKTYRVWVQHKGEGYSAFQFLIRAQSRDEAKRLAIKEYTKSLEATIPAGEPQ